MRKLMFVTLMALAVTASAQQLDFKSLDKIGEKAKSKTEINLDESMLKSATGLLNNQNVDEATAKRIVEGLKGVYLRSYEFDQKGAYSFDELKPLLDQLKPPNWTSFLRNKEDDEQTEIWMHRTNGQVDGLFLLAAEGNELTVISAIGLASLEDLSKLRELGLPQIGN